MLKHWICCAGVWLFSIAIGPIQAHAHDLPLDRMMNGFIKIESRQADFVVRVPLDLLRSVPFPLDGDYYNISASKPALEVALKALASNFILWEGNVRLIPSSAIGQLAPLSDRSFEDYNRAVAQVAEPLPPDTIIAFEQGYFDVHFVYPISSPKSVFSIRTTVAADLGEYTKLTLRFMPLGDAPRAMVITGGSGQVTLDPKWYEASVGFVRLGVEHILSGIDHLLFLLCLVIPFRRVSGLIPVITAFTVGHSITLIGTAYNIAPVGAWFPPFIETAIAVSILYMALENIVGASLRRRWIIAGLFGLVHGFGFADVLREQLQFAGSYAGIAVLVQHRDRDWSAIHSLRFRSRSRSALPGRNVGTDGSDCGVRTCRSYGLALDDRPCRCALENTVAPTNGSRTDDPGAMDRRRGPRGRRCEAPREMDRTQMARPCIADRSPIDG